MSEPPPTPVASAASASGGGAKAKNPLVTACEKNVAKALESSPLIRLLLLSMEQAGCLVRPHRHLACEMCAGDGLDGGYDLATNQVVLCANRCQTAAKVEEVLSHELVHLYDHCTKHVDFYNLDHLACTEVRAANLAAAQCRTPWDRSRLWTRREQCVKFRAAQSVSAIRGLTQAESLARVERVFAKCYQDREPVGRHTFSRKCEQAALQEFVSLRARVGEEHKDKLSRSRRHEDKSEEQTESANS